MRIFLAQRFRTQTKGDLLSATGQQRKNSPVFFGFLLVFYGILPADSPFSLDK